MKMIETKVSLHNPSFKMENKRGQINLSFGMIFSIILIIAFVVFAFYAIKMFLGLQESAKIAKFRENLQEDVDDLWKGTQGIQKVTYTVPNKIHKVCFKRWQFENLILEPKDTIDIQPVNISNINIARITDGENPYCFDNKNEKVEMILKKGFGEDLVMIERP